MTRYLRIAAAVMFALVAWAFIALWVRSYRVGDTWTVTHHINIGSNRGIVAFIRTGYEMPVAWRLAHYPLSHTAPDGWANQTTGGFGHRRANYNRSAHVYVPYWFLTTSSFALATLFAFRRSWRFTIRGLLIATTLFAVALGVGVYLL